jgi:hypothetical protein
MSKAQGNMFNIAKINSQRKLATPTLLMSSASPVFNLLEKSEQRKQ